MHILLPGPLKNSGNKLRAAKFEIYFSYDVDIGMVVKEKYKNNSYISLVGFSGTRDGNHLIEGDFRLPTNKVC